MGYAADPETASQIEELGKKIRALYDIGPNGDERAFFRQLNELIHQYNALAARYPHIYLPLLDYEVA